MTNQPTNQLTHNPFGALDAFETGSGRAHLYRLSQLEKTGVAQIDHLPFSIKVLLEAVLRHCDGYVITENDVRTLANYDAKSPAPVEVPFKVARVVMQDFTGVPGIVDLAAMRAAAQRLGADPKKINPLIPVDLVIDHSVQVDYAGMRDALRLNADIEFERNRERYEFLRWGQQAFDNFRVVPPATGIIHQVNLEYLAKVVLLRKDSGLPLAFPDTLVGTDSHTTMINGLGVVGWGVGGIEAEASMLGQPLYLLTPEVIGFKLHGQLREGVTATDLTLTITQMLRKRGVVDKFVEFYGSGLSEMGIADRATIANMAPEYGATMGFFPIDDRTLTYLRRTGRTDEEVERVERYAKEQGLFRADDTPDPEFTDTLELDLGLVVPSLAGPKRPQDRVLLSEMKQAFRESLLKPVKDRGFGLPESELEKQVEVGNWELGNGNPQSAIRHGAVVIAAITSCTNTSNPSVMLGAGLLARKAVERGLKPPQHVKTSLAPGSKVVTEYLQDAGVLPYLEALGFNVVGYGCTTCIGNSGPLAQPVAQAIGEGNLVAAAVLSGNRNFEGRINPLVKANYLASPPLVVAYALAGTVDIDLTRDPIGVDQAGKPVRLDEIWPTQQEISDTIGHSVKPEMFKQQYANVFNGNPRWNAIPVAGGELYPWSENSTYIQEPPFFLDLTPEVRPIQPITGMRVLGIFGDSVTTDHISPAGDIAENSPAGLYLKSKGIAKKDFNTYGTRRGNDRVMTRGTFANIRIKNLMLPGVEGGVTLHLPTGMQMSIYEAALLYQEAGIPLIVLAGKEYGAGSSRDWAAKGTLLLGVKAVLAESFERIHRSNLVGMGVLPLQFKPGQNVELLGLTGREVFDVEDLSDELTPRQDVTVQVTKEDGATLELKAILRIDTPVEVDYYRNGGILPTVLRKLIREA
ncbi:MAG TPA: aconitate hydratase AcnA [Anaerolineae bacterium]|nr:aconitate hydratase AcnA [Anaerolineae bacterium]